MNKRTIHLISAGLLLLWGAVLLYFHVSGRVVHYLPPDGIFRPMVLIAGIGLVIVALFNLATMQTAGAECCGHDHGSCGHDHSHDHEGCGHEHHHHDHAHKEGEDCCGHEHHDHGHKHGHEGCSHEHHHEHAHAGGHDHAHGILEESGMIGRIVAIMILAAPITWAAVRTPDRFSANAVMNKGLYNQNYSSTTRADQFSLKKEAGKGAAKVPSATANVPPAAQNATSGPISAPLPPATVAVATPDSARTPGSAPPAPTPAAGSPPAPAGGQQADAKSYGSFTLEDLKAQVPMSKEGNFILEVPELYYTAGDIEVQKVLTGQPVETIAQVLPEKVNNEDGKRLRIFRMLIQCCAADARPYSIPVQFADKAPAIKDMTWVKVKGKMGYVKEGGQTVPILEAIACEETTAPQDAMMY